MRLTPSEKEAICTIVQDFTHADGTLYLYGSRTDDTRRGGDIDLFLLVESERLKEEIELRTHSLLAEIKEAIGEQRIDFCIATKNDLENNPFYQSILFKALPLANWSGNKH